MATMVSSTSHLAVVGSFTTVDRKARGSGIETYLIDGSSGAWSGTSCYREVVNPSFLIADTKREILYAAHGDQDYASSYRVDRRSGRIEFLSKARTGGFNGVHLAVDPSGRFLLVANYLNGTVAVLPIEHDGVLRDFSRSLQLIGAPGPHRAEQGSSHPHQIVFDPSGRFVIVPDKGLDRVFVLGFDAGDGSLHLREDAALVARPGAGPRHMAFHPDGLKAYVLNEIDSTVSACRWDATSGLLEHRQIITSRASDRFGPNIAAAIIVSRCGRFVYASNRGDDDIACFRVGESDGRLISAGWTSSEGRDPRFIGLSPEGDTLYAANEQSDCIVAFALGATDGSLMRIGEKIAVASPATIAFMTPQS